MKWIPAILASLVLAQSAVSQGIIRTTDLMNKTSQGADRGEMFIFHDAAIDTLISRHIESNRIAGAIDGYRIQVFRKAGTTARDEAAKVMARVINEFPDLKAYYEFESPNFFIVRIGDFRTRIEATRVLARVRGTFGDSYLVRQKINLPEKTD
ncbi:MAG: SPOR domain-containing protein [Bacteroidetes bacterium]|nr:SPOR domain-containing protein [Bacteroidota bacterium]